MSETTTQKSFQAYYQSLKGAEKYMARMKFQSDIMSLTGMSMPAFYNRIGGRTRFTQAEKIAIHMYWQQNIDENISLGELFPKE